MKKNLRILVSSLLMCLSVVGLQAQSLSPSTKWHWEEGTIVIDTPARPAGQQNVLGLTVPKLDVVRVAFVGLGMRGPGAVARFTYIPGVQIVALCDYVPERACARPVCPLPTSTVARRGTRNCASVPTSTSCT